MSGIITALIFILVLAVLIFVHELGHFLFAKACRIRVDAFAIGFGPKLIAWGKNETKYSINVIPFGGYVKIFGENPDDESLTGPESARSFVNKPRWQQALVLVAGVLFNFIFAWLLYVGIFTYGVTATTAGFEKYASDFSNPRIMVTDVVPNSPAEKAGIQTGDVIKAVIPATVGQPVTGMPPQSIESIQNTIAGAESSSLTFEYTRGSSQPISVKLTPTTDLIPGKYAIGIEMDNVGELKLPFFTSVYEGGSFTLSMIKETAVGLYTFIASIFTGTANFSQVSGPVGIAGIVGSAAQLGFTYLLMITALISINLGVVNLIPFPALDGGRVLFVIIESISRRRISPRFSNVVNAVGFALLMLLMVAVTYKDIAKLIH